MSRVSPVKGGTGVTNCSTAGVWWLQGRNGKCADWEGIKETLPVCEKGLDWAVGEQKFRFMGGHRAPAGAEMGTGL